jgi:alkanesulfonate monooxygenase SsuD/methylene tetrahydromethanopterin reductase-like flavin-dependent oxidoreductase (luciferase family)
LEVALAAYRGRFMPSPMARKPLVMLSLTVVAADSDEEARLLFSSAQQATDAPLPPPIPGYEQTLEPQRLAVIKNAFRHSLVGGPDTVARGLREFVARYQPDEVIVTVQVFDHAARTKSLEILSAAAGLAPGTPVPATKALSAAVD